MRRKTLTRLTPWGNSQDCSVSTPPLLTLFGGGGVEPPTASSQNWRLNHWPTLRRGTALLRSDAHYHSLGGGSRVSYYTGSCPERQFIGRRVRMNKKGFNPFIARLLPNGGIQSPGDHPRRMIQAAGRGYGYMKQRRLSCWQSNRWGLQKFW